MTRRHKHENFIDRSCKCLTDGGVAVWMTFIGLVGFESHMFDQESGKVMIAMALLIVAVISIRIFHVFGVDIRRWLDRQNRKERKNRRKDRHGTLVPVFA